MNRIEPKVASNLAAAVYAVQDKDELEDFLLRPEFSRKPSGKAVMEAEVGGRIIRNATDSFGLCAVGGKGYEKDLFLIFRGSTSANSGADWVSNFKIGLDFTESGRPVHVGFLNIFNSMKAEIQAFLSSNLAPGMTVHCIGHSLGGAIATLTSEWVKSSRSSTNVRLYTFGAPKPGMTLFSSSTTSKIGLDNIHRVYHATDPVPMIPLFPFVHPPYRSYGHYISSSENILSAEAHDMIKYRNSVSNLTWIDLKRRAPQYTTDHAIEEWLRTKIIVDPNSPKTWQWLNEALIYVLSRVSGKALSVLQAGITGLVTLADKLAWILIKAKDLVKGAWNGSVWLLRFIKKAMQALGMKVVDKITDVTQVLIRRVLERLMQKTLDMARKAVQHISR